ncbi:MAG: hypothetical protein A4E26_00078 [Methanobacterium sp. PtaU1.Bin097]|nr:MAG: hypothetical protein A4E26_00078 [Methanobacterium sp. PtaU1.Bin097]
MICTEFISRIGNSDFCLTYESPANLIYCKVYIGTEESKVGATIAKKKLPQESISLISPRTTAFTQFKRKLKAHSTLIRYFEDNDISPDKYLLRVEEALEKLQEQYDDWVDEQEEKEQKEREELENRLKLEAEEKYYEYLELLNDLEMTPIEHLLNVSTWLAASEEYNIAAGVLALTSTIWHFLPIWVQVTGRQGSGKSKIEEGVLAMIPPEKIERGESTLAATYALAETDPYYLDGKIISVGDIGSEKEMERNEDLFDLAKALYSDKYQRSRKKMEKLEKGGPNELIIQELKGYCSLFFTTVQELANTQHVSRTTSLTPVDDMHAYNQYTRYNSTDTWVNRARKKIDSEVKLIQNMIRYFSYIYKEMEVDIINPYYDTMIKWTMGLPDPKRAREQLDSLLKVIVLFNNSPNQRYHIEEDKVIYIVSKKDILLFNRLFRLNIGVSAKAMKFYDWIQKDGRNGKPRVPILDDFNGEYEDASISLTYQSDFNAIFTVKSIKNKISSTQRHFDRKEISVYCDQLIDAGLLTLVAHDKNTNERMMGISRSQGEQRAKIPFCDEDLESFFKDVLSIHAGLGDKGIEWVKKFVLLDKDLGEPSVSNIKFSVSRNNPWTYYKNPETGRKSMISVGEKGEKGEITGRVETTQDDT